MRLLSIVRSKTRVLLVSLVVVISIFVAFFIFLNKERYKILLIGLDGASWKVMLPLIDEGKLPNINKLMNNGCWGKLRVIDESISEVIWTSIATGKPPKIHGINNSLIQDADTKEIIIPTAKHRKVKAIWNILSEHKKKVGVVGYRVSWPAEKVNGVMISEGANEDNYFSSRYSEPSFKRLCSEKTFDSFKKAINIPIMLKREDKWVFNQDYFTFNISKYLLKNRKFDFFCLYFRGIDISSHCYWKYMFPGVQDASLEDTSQYYKDTIKNYYIWCDSSIGDLLRIIDKNTTVIVVSDHGFKTSLDVDRKYFFSKFDNLLKVSGLEENNYNSKTVILKDTQNNYWWQEKKNISIIGELSEAEFNAVRENAKNILKNIKIKETGQPIFKIPNDTNNGFVLEVDREHFKWAPEHHILINSREYKILDFLIRDPNSGTHDNTDAIIILSGQNIRHHQQLKGASEYDITPTLLYLLDLPVAADMSGEVLVNAINRDLLNKKPPRYIYTYEKEKKQTMQKPIRLPVEEEKIKERMRSLGYIN